MQTVNIAIRCLKTVSEELGDQRDLCAAIESVVSVALLELFDKLEVCSVTIEDEHGGSGESFGTSSGKW
jgi:hypothetical protein